MIPRLLRSKIFFLLIVVIFLFSAIELTNEIGRRYKVNREIRQQQEKVEQLKKDNSDLSQLINYLNTDQFIEKEARAKLGLSKPGESVAVFDNAFGSEATSTVPQNSNFDRWLKYFWQ